MEIIQFMASTSECRSSFRHTTRGDEESLWLKMRYKATDTKTIDTETKQEWLLRKNMTTDTCRTRNMMIGKQHSAWFTQRIVT